MTVTITKLELQQLIEQLNDMDVWTGDPFDEDEDADEYDVQVRTEYSGRGMYGDRCLGFVCASPAGLMFSLGRALARMESEDPGDWDTSDLADAFGSPSQDSMGRDSIVYFPRIQVDLVD